MCGAQATAPAAGGDPPVGGDRDRPRGRAGSRVLVAASRGGHHVRAAASDGDPGVRPSSARGERGSAPRAPPTGARTSGSTSAGPRPAGRRRGSTRCGCRRGPRRARRSRRARPGARSRTASAIRPFCRPPPTSARSNEDEDMEVGRPLSGGVTQNLSDRAGKPPHPRGISARCASSSPARPASSAVPSCSAWPAIVTR